VTGTGSAQQESTGDTWAPTTNAPDPADEGVISISQLDAVVAPYGWYHFTRLPPLGLGTLVLAVQGETSEPETDRIRTPDGSLTGTFTDQQESSGTT
jgi:hypothetical protein